MKQCCLCGQSGHESSECGWYRAVPMSTVGHVKHSINTLRSAVLYGLYKGSRADEWFKSNQS